VGLLVTKLVVRSVSQDCSYNPIIIPIPGRPKYDVVFYIKIFVELSFRHRLQTQHPLTLHWCCCIPDQQRPSNQLARRADPWNYSSAKCQSRLIGWEMMQEISSAQLRICGDCWAAGMAYPLARSACSRFRRPAWTAAVGTWKILCFKDRDASLPI
jgi:hypothetical protein